MILRFDIFVICIRNTINFNFLLYDENMKLFKNIVNAGDCISVLDNTKVAKTCVTAKGCRVMSTKAGFFHTSVGQQMLQRQTVVLDLYRKLLCNNRI